MIIREAVVHAIEKVASSNTALEKPRSALSPIDAHMLKLGEDVLSIYGKTTNNYGTFNADTETYRFPSYLNSYHTGADQFLDFSLATNHLIATRMAESYPSTGGYALFMRYESQGREWLLIVMLKLKSRTGIDVETLELNDSFSFDVEHVHEAARIDLAKWIDNEQPYLSFIKKSGRQDDVTVYFRRSLGCTEYTDSKHNTDAVLKAVDAYCQSLNYTPEQKKEARRVTYTYCDDKERNKQPVNIIALSALIDDQNPTNFNNYIREQNLPINETFSPHRSTFNRFNRIKDEFRTIKLSFDVEDVINETVDYDALTNSVIIKNVPISLKNQIFKAKGNDIES